MLNTLVVSAQINSGIQSWSVGALLKVIANSLEARFNPVAVQGEISGFTRAASGHCYFSLKDEYGQIRCAMFRRAASLLDFTPRDGQWVELRGKLGVYDARGELQLVVESLRQAGQGALFEQFLSLRIKLQAEGLFENNRKRALPLMPRAIGVVTSTGAAALHDVVTALRRRVPFIPVVIYPASVQGAQAPAELCLALGNACLRGEVDVLLLVRGGGSMEDLWAFNNEQLGRAVAASAIAVVCGVGHETDFTIADFCADVRAPTPTAAAELSAQPRDVWTGILDSVQSRLQGAVDKRLQSSSQRLDLATARFSRPSHGVAPHRAGLAAHHRNLQHAARNALNQAVARLQSLALELEKFVSRALQRQQWRLASNQIRLDSLDPHMAIKRGYVLLASSSGSSITGVEQMRLGQRVRAILVNGEVDLSVVACRPI